MHEPLTERQIRFMEQWYSPVANIECLVPENIKAPQKWSNRKTKCVKIRNYQHTMIDYSLMYAEDPRKSPEENARVRRVVGTCYNIASRDVGKSYFLWLDAFIHLMHAKGGESLLAAPTDEKLKKVGRVLINLCQNHPFFKIFHKKTNKSGSIGINSHPPEIATERGHTLYGRNEKIEDPEKVGDNFHSIHAEKIFYEEFSYATAKGAEKRVDSENSLGCIERMSGIPDLRPGSPLGDILSNKNKKSFICRLPQCFRRDWNDVIRQRKIEKYKGRFSTSYKLNCEGEILFGAFSKWDMQRIKKQCLKTDEHIKFFELNKEIFEGVADFQENKESETELLNRLGNTLPIIKVPSVKRICFKEGTEILTSSGWKDFREININEKVLTLNVLKNESYYSNIEEIISQDFEGKMVEYNSENLIFSVTPNHKMLVQRPQKIKENDYWTFVDAKDLKVNQRIKRDLGEVIQKNKDYKYKPFIIESKSKLITSQKTNKYVFKLEDWLEFLGWYVSEGSIYYNKKYNTYRIFISQIKVKNRDKIRDLLKRLNLPFQETKSDFRFNSKILYYWLKKNCYQIFDDSPLKKKTQYNCYNKKAPDFIRELSSKYINLFLDAAVLGDGWITLDGRKAISTTSYKLANDYHELILKSGIISTIEEIKPKIRKWEDRNYCSYCKKSYTVYFWRKNTLSKIRSNNIYYNFYKGKVYCVNVNPNHTIYVKYKGKSFWSGNCASDIGTSGSPSEVAIYFGDKDNNFKYTYQISLFQMTTKEQAFIFNWLYRVIDGAFISLDNSNADGEAISERLVKEYKIPREDVCEFKMTKNIKVGFKLDEKGKVLVDENRKPIELEVYTKTWAVQQLEIIFYEGKVKIPYDEKFLEQFANHFEKPGSSGRPTWGSSSDEHLVDTFLQFALCVWDKCWRTQQKIVTKKRVIGHV